MIALSSRLAWQTPSSPFAAALAAARAAERELVDLTVSNPTVVGFELPTERIAAALSRGVTRYDPDPRGLRSAREALAVALSSPSDAVAPDDLLLTASTSEAYSLLFKTFADPGARLLTTAPAYPLLDHLAALDGLTLDRVPLEYEGRWAIDVARLERAIRPETRALILVSPNNPTGNYLTPQELDAVAGLAARHRLPVICDEVFFDYPLHESVPHAPTAAARMDTLAIALGGLSKSAALPHLKLAWVRLGGPVDERRRLLAALELASDSYLSVGTPVQAALPELLALAPSIRLQLLTRIRRNYDQLRKRMAEQPTLERLTSEGGWTAVLRLPQVMTDEAMAIDLLENVDVVVHPGYLFDFERDGHLVLSLLPEPDRFDAGVDRLLGRAAEWVRAR